MCGRFSFISQFNVFVVVKPTVTVRRVLPEHEGKYKVSLPKGSTKKTRDILAKHSAMQSDKTKKKSIFDRLNSKDVEMMDDDSSDEPVEKSSASIFNRLGSYKELEKSDKRSKGGSGILKNSTVSLILLDSAGRSSKFLHFSHNLSSLDKLKIK